MRKLLRISIIAAILLGSSACYPGGFTFNNETVRLRDSGKVEVIDYDFTGFDGVDASHVFDVDIEQGDDYSVVVTADETVVEYLDVSAVGGSLRLSLKPGYNYNFSGLTLKAEVRLPDLAEVALSGASSAYLHGFESPQPLRLDLSGSSRVDGEAVVGVARFSLSGSSEVDLHGSCASLDLDISGGSTADLADFYAEDVNVNASGASEAVLWTDGTLDVNASGDSRITYVSGADLGSIHTSGTSSVRER
jgi:hypothetical protein